MLKDYNSKKVTVIINENRTFEFLRYINKFNIISKLMDLFLTIGLKIIKIWHILGKSTKEIKKKNLDFPFITSQSYEYKKYDYKNPYGIVKNMAYNEAYINERFDKKKYLLENQLYSWFFTSNWNLW